MTTSPRPPESGRPPLWGEASKADDGAPHAFWHTHPIVGERNPPRGFTGLRAVEQNHVGADEIGVIAAP